tara:strand:+ start:734 stop:1015 length:282 start_codon:yes stop_codon:yes gene_type:complete
MIETFTTSDITEVIIVSILGYFIHSIAKDSEENKNEIKDLRKENHEEHKDDRIRIRELETNKISRQEVDRILKENHAMGKDIKQLLVNQGSNK